MKKTNRFMVGLLGAAALSVASVGLSSGNEFAPLAGSTIQLQNPADFDPDETPLSVDGPVRLANDLLIRSKANLEQENEMAKKAKGDIRIQPPKRYSADPASIASAGEIEQVQYRMPSFRKKNNNTRANELPTVQVETTQEEVVSKHEAEHPDMLKRSIQLVLTNNSKRAITTLNNTPGELMLMALPYGADAKVYQPNPQASKDRTQPKGNYIYSIGTLCWNYPCSGKTLLRSDGKNVYARIGTGYQNRPAAFMAMLAMSNIMPNYEMKVDGSVYSIANLVATEKAAVSKGMNLSMALVGLAFYGDADETWKNDMGESWNIEKMVIQELNRPIDQGTSDVTDWLLGLTAAVNLYEEEGRALKGPLALAKRQLGTYHKFVLSVQNENYLWHPKFFLFKGTTPDEFETLYSGGHILRWLVLSLPEEQLNDVRVRKAVANLASFISRIPVNTAAATLSERQLEGLAVSLQALAIYHQRKFSEESITEYVQDKNLPPAIISESQQNRR